MKKLSIAVSAVAIAAALLPALASAQNIAIVNGKAVPKARFESFMTQITKQGGQERTPELEQQVRDEIVLREIFVQEAERRGLQRDPEFRAQMEVARIEANKQVRYLSLSVAPVAPDEFRRRPPGFR